LILVLDIGGGTTDFTLIAVRERAGEIRFSIGRRRQHILLGRRQYDAAARAHAREQDAETRPTSSHSLVQHGDPRKSACSKKGFA